MMKLLKYGGIAVASAAIVALSSLMLFLCSTWLLMSTPFAQSMALCALSMCGSGFIALMAISGPSQPRDPVVPFEPNPPLRCTKIVLN